MKQSVLYSFGRSIDLYNVALMIQAAHHERLKGAGRFSLRQVVEFGIYPSVLDEAGLRMVAEEAEAMGWPDPPPESSGKDH